MQVEYFKKRPGPLAKGGLSALKQSLAGIYYVPFPCGMSLYFRASGQSIPNRCALLTGQAAAVQHQQDLASDRVCERAGRNVQSRLAALSAWHAPLQSRCPPFIAGSALSWLPAATAFLSSS